MNTESLQLVRMKDLVNLLSMSESTIRRGVKNGTFPKPKKISPRVTVWRLSDIHKLISERS